jgi:tRNA-specific 2-thiouridylase
VLGQHSGVHQFTIGQRRGLAIASTSRRWIKEIRPEEGVIVLTDKESSLSSQHFVAAGMNWIAEFSGQSSLECEVQIRYRHSAKPASVSIGKDGMVSVTFHQPVRAITPGQAAVFYEGDRVLGRGWIMSIGP